MNQSSAKTKIIWAVLLAGVLPLMVSLAAHFIFGDARHVDEPLHEGFELTGSCIALAVAMLLLLRTRHEKESQHLYWVVASLIAMGLLDGLHGVHGISVRSWQRHGATLIGGVLFGLVWLPLPPAVIRRKGLFMFIVAGLALALGLWWGSERMMPVTWDPVGLFTLPVKAANALGGVGFLAAAVFFCRRYLRQSHPDDLVFASQTILFGMASLLFVLSQPWTADWWVWHGFRLLAFMIVLVAAYEMIVTLYRNITLNVQELEGRVQERTADLLQTNEVLRTQITERKQAEEAHGKLAAIVESADDSIIGEDLEGIILSWNRGAEIAYGYNAKEIVGKSISLLMPPSHPDEYKEVLAKIARGETIKHYETQRRRKDGQIIHVSLSISPGKDTSGKIISASTIARDITDRKRAEDDLRKYRDELEQRVAERTKELTTANKELEGFSYSVSHDLRAPLRAIHGFANILLEDYSNKLDSEGQRYLNVITTNTRQMGKLIDDILTLSRLGRKEIKTTQINMNDLASSIFMEIRSLEPDRKLELNLKDIPSIQGDKALIRQALLNLISNSIKFTKHREVGLIEIGGNENDTETIYYIKDNGVGFDMKYSNKLFGVFQRLHSSEEFEGTGIGLAIVQRVISRHGGRVWGEGKVEEGATFYFALPKKRDA